MTFIIVELPKSQPEIALLASFGKPRYRKVGHEVRKLSGEKVEKTTTQRPASNSTALP